LLKQPTKTHLTVEYVENLSELRTYALSITSN
jgi:hypothetical protein